MNRFLEIPRHHRRVQLGAREAGKTDNIRELLQRSVKAPFARLMRPKSRKRQELRLRSFLALKNISFDINQGDVIGINRAQCAGKRPYSKFCRGLPVLRAVM